MLPIDQAAKLQSVRYDVRGPILQEAERLQAEGRTVTKLNIGNPAPFGFRAPEALVEAVARALRGDGQGYSDSRGVLPAREAVVEHYREIGIPDIGPEHVLLGNGVSELISLVLQALIDAGDEVLVPAPDYPLWTAQVTLSGGTAVHYPCVEAAGWAPDLDAIEALITPRTKALVLINPNNPTGAVYPAETVRRFARIAEAHGLVLLADEIYDRILYDDARHEHAAKHVSDTLCITFGGLSKAWLAAGFRSGWLLLSGNRDRATGVLEGLTLLANMRMCANVPAQFAIPAALTGPQPIEALIAPGGRLAVQRDVAHRLLTEIEGVSCVKPQGALYLFPRLDPERFPIRDDQAFVIEMLRATGILVTNGTGFNYPTPDHLRFVILPDVATLEDAIGKIAGFLDTQRRD